MVITIKKSPSNLNYWIFMNDHSVLDAKTISEASRFADALQSAIYIASNYKQRPDITYRDGADKDYSEWITNIANRSH